MHKSFIIPILGATAVVERVKPQPPKDWHFAGYMDNFAGFGSPNRNAGMSVNLPYRIGDVVAVKECWAEHCVSDKNGVFHDLYTYKSDYPDDYKKPIQWRSPITQPRSSVRKRAEITGVECVRVRDIDEQQALMIGGWEYKNCPFHKAPIKSFRYKIWEPKHGPEVWDQNEFVFISSFKYVEK